MPSDSTQHKLKLMNTKLGDKGEYMVQVGKSFRKVQLNIKGILPLTKIKLQIKFSLCINYATNCHNTTVNRHLRKLAYTYDYDYDYTYR